MRADVERAFARASVQSPVVQLADGTWNNYVPCDALTPRRLLDEWYPTDVDSGPLHLARLGAVDSARLARHGDAARPRGQSLPPPMGHGQRAGLQPAGHRLSAAGRTRGGHSRLLQHDGLRLLPSPALPAGTSLGLGPVLRPPSTDGAWFELYRNLLLNELEGDGTLLIGQATPRAWLADGQRIAVDRAPTYFGPVNLRVHSAAATGSITARIEFLSDRPRPTRIRLRLRHPDKAMLRSVTVNGARMASIRCRPRMDRDCRSRRTTIPRGGQLLSTRRVRQGSSAIRPDLSPSRLSNIEI